VPCNRGTFALLQGNLQGTFPFAISPIPRHFARTSHPLLPYPNTGLTFTTPRRETASLMAAPHT